jgi:hypothetical protein
MNIRKYRPEDAGKVDEIYDRCWLGTFGRPNLSHVLSAAVIEDDGKVIAFGCLELMVEAVMIVDTDAPVDKRVEALTQLIETAKFVARDKTFERFYVFPSDSHFLGILMKHFEFKNSSPILSCELSVSDSRQEKEVKNG